MNIEEEVGNLEEEIRRLGLIQDDGSSKETYDKNVAECEERGIQKNPKQKFYNKVRGKKKGKVRGLGTGANLYFKRSSTTCTSSIMSQLSVRLEDLERAIVDLETERVALERERVEMERVRLKMEREHLQMVKDREEHSKKNVEYLACLAEMKKTMEGYIQMFSQCNISFPFTLPRDPPDASGSGGACAT